MIQKLSRRPAHAAFDCADELIADALAGAFRAMVVDAGRGDPNDPQEERYSLEGVDTGTVVVIRVPADKWDSMPREIDGTFTDTVTDREWTRRVCWRAASVEGLETWIKYEVIG